MNALASNFALFTEALEKFTRFPLAADLFAWCSMTGTDIRLRSRLELLNVPCSSVTRVSDLKARIERRIVSEQGKRERGHWSFDGNRLIALKQALASIEAFEREA